MTNIRISSDVREQLILSARQMRAKPTSAESALWQRLRKKQVGAFKFRRQHIIHTFIVDFYCPAARLVVEVDGHIHLRIKEYDQARDDLLNSLGYRVLRIRNELVETDLDGVINLIIGEIRRR